jgi:hypothetical protein
MLLRNSPFKHVRLLAGVALLAAFPAVASAEPCPEDARYATNGAGQAFCLFENMSLPSASDLAPYCHYLDYGYIGFHWTETPATAGYVCPEGSYKTTNGAGLGFCIFDNLSLPDAGGLTSYCHYLEDGYIGYHWDMCPAGARFATNGAGLNFCLFEDVALPNASDVTPYCHYLESGYMGFHWTETPATAGYVCPEGSYKTTNGAGLGFCIFDDLWLPPAEDLAPYCHYLEDGYLGFSWTD